MDRIDNRHHSVRYYTTVSNMLGNRSQDIGTFHSRAATRPVHRATAAEMPIVAHSVSIASATCPISCCGRSRRGSRSICRRAEHWLLGYRGFPEQISNGVRGICSCCTAASASTLTVTCQRTMVHCLAAESVSQSALNVFLFPSLETSYPYPEQQPP